MNGASYCMIMTLKQQGYMMWPQHKSALKLDILCNQNEVSLLVHSGRPRNHGGLQLTYHATDQEDSILACA